MYVFVFLILYLIFVKLCMGSIKKKRIKEKYLIINSIILILILSLRYHKIDVFYDTEQYYNFYRNISKIDFNIIYQNSRLEIGYIMLNKLFSLIFKNPQTIFFIEAFICISGVSYFIYKYSKDPFLSLFLYITAGGFFFDFTAFRQSIAIYICLFSVEYIKKRRIVMFLLIILFASLFHKTALVFCILYFIADKKINFKNLIFTLGILLIILLNGQKIINLGNSFFNMNYLGYQGSVLAGIIPIISYLCTLFMTYMKRDKIKDYTMYNMLFLGCILYLLRYITLAMERISFYFTISFIILLPNVLKLIVDKRLKKIIYMGIIIIYLIVYFRRLSYLPIGNYKFLWEYGG